LRILTRGTSAGVRQPRCIKRRHRCTSTPLHVGALLLVLKALLTGGRYVFGRPPPFQGT